MDNLISFKLIKSKLKSQSNAEAELIRKAITGNREAFTELFKLYKTYLYKTAFFYVKNEDKALDILQECAYKGFLNIRKLREPEHFKTWITKILINAAFFSMKESISEVSLENDIEAVYKPEGVSLEEKLDLYNAIDSLRDNYKTVIVLKYFNDLTIETISRIMDMPENTVKTYLRRAKESLSQVLKEGYLND